jgi:hypothetical protein
MKSIQFLLGLLISFWIILPQPDALANDEIIARNSPVYNELMPVAIKWKNAVLNKNINVLVDFALLEDREYLIPELKDENSKLYQDLFKEKNSVYEILRRLKKVKIVLVKHKGLEQAGQGVTVYYYDEGRAKLRFPLASNEEQKLYDQGEIVLKFFFKTEGRWFTSYEFGD